MGGRLIQTNILPRFCEKCLDFFLNLKDMINILWLRLKPRPSRERVDRVLNKYTYTSLVTDSLILFRSPRHIVWALVYNFRFSEVISSFNFYGKKQLYHLDECLKYNPSPRETGWIGLNTRKKKTTFKSYFKLFCYVPVSKVLQ